MSKIQLMKHQVDVLEATKDFNKVAYYLDMGLGKTFVGSKKAISLGKNILVVCQKSKVDDWVNHFREYYGYKSGLSLEPIDDVLDLTDKKQFDLFKGLIGCEKLPPKYRCVAVINYDLLWRRPELANLSDFTLMLDESSLIQNDTSKRAKFVLKKLNPVNVVLLSGTPTSGKYERLWSQMHLLGWGISKDLYLKQYMVYDTTYDGYPIIVGYKNVERLKSKMRQYGCIFMKTEEVLDLPEQNFIKINVKHTKAYNEFVKHSMVEVEGKELIGDTTLTQLLYERMLLGAYNEHKLEALGDLIESTNDRLIIFYNFNDELEKIKSICGERPLSFVNGSIKDLTAYEEHDDSITLCQYQSGSMGLNLQKANKIIYFTPPLSSELFEQSKKRIHRIGQNNTCFYYQLISGREHRIYEVLDMRKDYTDALFEEDNKNVDSKECYR